MFGVCPLFTPTFRNSRLHCLSPPFGNPVLEINITKLLRVILSVDKLNLFSSSFYRESSPAAESVRISILRRGNSLETPNVWGFVLFSPRLFDRAEMAATWTPRQQLTGRGSHVAAMSAPKIMMKFFNWFFFFISLGSLLAVTVLVYIQDHVGRRWGYGICATAILLGLLLFLSGTRRYRFKKLVGSPLTQMFFVLAAAWRNRKLPLPADSALLYNVGEDKLKQPLPHTTHLRLEFSGNLLNDITGV